jgi:hypothetical protein
MAINKIKNIVFGCSSPIGMAISKKLKRKETLFTSRKKPEKFKNWIRYDLNKSNFKYFPNKVEKIFFAASPYYLRKHLRHKKKNIYANELSWLKNCLGKIECNKIIYISSSSIYQKNHPIGKIKKQCEKYIMNFRSIEYQIWRPYNIIGDCIINNLSDHFHNILIKKILINKKTNIILPGNINDTLGYSSAEKFANVLVHKSKNNNSFIMNYKNNDKIKLGEIIKIFIKLFKKKIVYKFIHRRRYLSKNTMKSIHSNEDSIFIIKKYYNQYKNEKEM